MKNTVKLLTLPVIFIGLRREKIHFSQGTIKYKTKTAAYSTAELYGAPYKIIWREEITILNY
jgi:hypothetical protein